MQKTAKNKLTGFNPLAPAQDVSSLQIINPPNDRLLRLPQVLEIIPIGKSSFWKMVAEGRAPKGIKLSARTTCWRLSEIQKLVEDLAQGRG